MSVRHAIESRPVTDVYLVGARPTSLGAPRVTEGRSPPTAHLDHVQVDGVLALLSGLVGEDRVMVVATHDDRVEPLGNQVLDLGRHQEERRR